MLNRVLLIIISLGFFFVHEYAGAMEIPSLKNVQVSCNVEVDKTSKIFRYSYRLSNPSENTGQISIIEIDISEPIGGQTLNDEGLTIQKGYNFESVMLSSSFKDVIAEKGALLEKAIIPIGALTPVGWLGDISLEGTMHWGSSQKKYRILPGQSLDGFVLVSPGIPAIREILIHPKWVLVVDGYVSEGDIEKSNKIKEEIAYKGKTIGPTAPPADFKPLQFLDYIIGMKHQSVSLGWIKNKGVENSLDAKLDNARSKIDQGDFSAAKNILGAFINEVEAQGCENYEKCPEGKHLTPEAYALLKYNARYLIDNLK